MEAATQTPGEQLRAARKAAGLTQTAVARQAGVTTSYVCMVEKGLTVPLDTRDAMARACGASAGSFWPC